MGEIDIPKIKMTDYGRAQFSTEVAFNSLLEQAKKLGLEVTPVMGLMYLPTQELTENFKQACRAILFALTPTDTHVTGSDGKDYWIGDESIPG